MSVGVWLKAARLKTLPLAISGCIMGNTLAYIENDKFSIAILSLSLLTAVILQVLSNFSNDYGDFKNGVDDKRTDRVMANGEFNEKSMRLAIALLIALSFIFGIALLYFSYKNIGNLVYYIFAVGILAIAAAYFYTAGKKPYGYYGLGDISVFIFFGLVAVMGTYFLQTGQLNTPAWLMAIYIGLLSTAVLNVNNIRDIYSDSLANKITIPVYLGYNKALVYHIILLTSAGICYLCYLIFSKAQILPYYLLAFIPLFVKHYKALSKANHANAASFNAELKRLSVLTLITTLVFCTALFIIH